MAGFIASRGQFSLHFAAIVSQLHIKTILATNTNLRLKILLYKSIRNFSVHIFHGMRLVMPEACLMAQVMRPVTTSKPLMVRCSLTFSFWTPNCLLSVFIVRSYRTSHVWITCTPCKKLINYIPSQIKHTNQAMRHTPKNIFRFHFPPIFIIEVISFVRLKVESTNCAHDAIIHLARFSQMLLLGA